MATAFEKQFAAARKSGKKEFSFGGKQFNTRLKEEPVAAKKQTLPKTGPIPAVKPQSGPGRKPTGPQMVATTGYIASKPTTGAATAKVEVKPKAKAPSVMKQAVKIQTGPVTKSYADRNKEAAQATAKATPKAAPTKTKSSGLFALGPQTASYASRNKKPTGGGW